jgi:hypothetical protein
MQGGFFASKNIADIPGSKPIPTKTRPNISSPSAHNLPHSLARLDLVDIEFAKSSLAEKAAEANMSSPVESKATTSKGTPSKSSISAHVREQIAQVQAQGRKAMMAIRRKISSKSPKEEWPKTWEEYDQRYARVSILSSAPV